jgi:hypothetical protein
MGRWSVLVGERFIDWIGVPNRMRWLDIGTATALYRAGGRRCTPVNVQAFDPSVEWLCHAESPAS